MANVMQEKFERMGSFLKLVTLIVFVASASAQEATAPPPSDPIRPGIPKLFLTTAGTPPYDETEIQSYTEYAVCPDDYPTGFSIRCEVSNAGTVFWRTNGNIFDQQYVEPYLLAGNSENYINPYAGLESVSRVRVACQVLTRQPVWVDLVRSC